MIETYQSYKFSWREMLLYFIQWLIIISIVGILFYQSLITILLLSPVFIFYLKIKRSSIILNRKRKLNNEFRNGILSLLSSLEAGYSIENAFEEALKDLKLLYEEDALIIREFSYIANQIKLNITVEKALLDLGYRSGLEDIKSFAEVFATAKRTGGDLIKIIKTTCNIISDKIDVKREISTAISAKKLEADIMKVIPFGLLGYLQFIAPELLSPLYHNFLGVCFMTIMLLLYFGASLLIDWIMAIEV